MIKGKIEGGLHPKIIIEAAGENASKKFSALVDTGFDMELALHHNEASRLGLRITEFVKIDYANGERGTESVCPARVLWHGKWKDIDVVLSNDEEPAIGTLLLKGSEVNMSFVKNKLTIRKPTTNRRRKR